MIRDNLSVHLRHVRHDFCRNLGFGYKNQCPAVPKGQEQGIAGWEMPKRIMLTKVNKVWPFILQDLRQVG